MPLRAASVLLGVLLGLNPFPACSHNVHLSTVSGRDSVQLTIYKPEDLTLVRETRRVHLRRGENRLEFSWADTLIDPTSVALRFLTTADQCKVLSTTFPPTGPQRLYWTVVSELAGEIPVEISYFTSGIHWDADYVMVADQDERHLTLQGFLKISNRSGEAYQNTEVEVVAGTIPLVDKISALASQGQAEPFLPSEESHASHRRAIREALQQMATDEGTFADTGLTSQKGVRGGKPGEYFRYSVTGTQALPEGWSLRIPFLEEHAVPLEIQYRFRPEEYGDQLVRMYLVRNDSTAGLGMTHLPGGPLQVYQKKGSEGLRFLASQLLPEVPIGKRMEINLGQQPQVSFERVRLKCWRDNLWLRLGEGNVYRRVGDDRIEPDLDWRVSGWDEHQLFAERVRNYTGERITLEVRRRFSGDVEIKNRLGIQLHDSETVELVASVGAGETRELLYEVITHMDHNAKQNQIIVMDAEVSRLDYGPTAAAGTSGVEGGRP